MVKTTIIAKIKSIATCATRVLKRIGFLAKAKSPWLLAIGATIGVITSVIISIKQVPKAKKNLDNAYEKYGDDIKTIHKVKAVVVPFIPSIISVALTIASIFTGVYVSNERVKQAVNMAATAQSIVQTYEKELIEKVGDAAAEKIKKDVTEKHAAKEEEKNPEKKERVIEASGDDVLYYDKLSGRKFTSNTVKIGQAINDINSELIHRINWGCGSWFTLNEAYEMIGLDDIAIGYDMGWEPERVHELRIVTSGIIIDGKPYAAINFDIPPRGRD